MLIYGHGTHHNTYDNIVIFFHIERCHSIEVNYDFIVI